jgi:hypothetical protein
MEHFTSSYFYCCRLTILLFSVRMEQSIGKQSPMVGEDRTKSTVLARIQRIEGTMGDMSRTLEHILVVLKNMNERCDRSLSIDQDEQQTSVSIRSTKSTASNLSVKFSSIQEEIP